MSSTPPKLEGGTVAIRAPVYLIALAVILFFTGLNAIYNVLNVEYRGNHSSFLPGPWDRDGDLIKAALSFPPYPTGSTPEIDRYLAMYAANPFEKLGGVGRGEISSLHITPLMIVSLLAIKQAILQWGPDRVVYFYILFALACVAHIVLEFRGSYWGAALAFLCLGLSFPFLMIVCTGNYGSLLGGLCLIFFLYEIIAGQRAMLAGLLLALAVNLHPNAVLLAPLMLVFDFRVAIRAAFFSAVFAIALFSVSALLAEHFYPGYNLAVFQQALHVYYQVYVIDGHGGREYNNSFFGAVWPLVEAFHLPVKSTIRVLGALQTGILMATALLIFTSAFYYLKHLIDRYEYAFAISSLYILASTIFATYHLFFLFIFILIFAGRSFASEPGRRHYAILGITVFVLAPKFFAYFFDVPLQVFVNPLVLVFGVSLILLGHNDTKMPREIAA